MSIVIRKEAGKVNVRHMRRKFVADKDAIEEYTATVYGEAA